MSDQLAVRLLPVTTHNTHKKQTSMPLAGFEPTIPASECPQTHNLDRMATGIGIFRLRHVKLGAAIHYKYT
jgi:hypothetical protein